MELVARDNTSAVNTACILTTYIDLVLSAIGRLTLGTKALHIPALPNSFPCDQNDADEFRCDHGGPGR